jgi:dTDP-4-dehydrorhamnose 3,5-epimerase
MKRIVHMAVRYTKTSLPGVLIIEPVVFKDDRGFFLETHHQRKYVEGGIDTSFVQDNRSHSKKGVLRGLHYQLRYPQGKLVYVITGEIFDVAVDIRRGSPTFGKWEGIYLSSDNNRQVFVPEGFAHGFCVVSETADVLYKCTDFYDPDDEFGILWSDPTMSIEWPVASPVLSSKDSQYPRLTEIAEGFLPRAAV